jgi:predicted permease
MFAVLGATEAPGSMDDLRRLYQQKERLGTADYGAVAPAYFRALGIPLVRGRLFDERDGPGTAHVGVISESLARARWPGADPIGTRIEFGNMDGDLRPITVVGIVGDTRQYGLERPARPTLYVNLLQRPRFSTTLVLRSSVDTQAIVAAARGVLRAVAPDVPPRVRTFEQIYAASLGARRFNLVLVAVFAGTALVLALAGIYGVMTYSVTRRRREMGVRMALGANPRDVFAIVLGQGLKTTALGTAIGLVAAVGLARLLESLLFGVTPTDPVTFVSTVAVVTTVSALACYLPARRATGADPMEALRQE